jgi:hypothetical protein
MALGDVLRNLGSVLNPQVNASMDAEERQRQQFAQQIGVMGLQQKIAQQSPQYQMQMEQLQNERGFRQEIGGAGGDPLKVAAAAVKYGKPEIAMNIYNQAEARADRARQAKDALDVRIYDIQSRSEDRALTREQQAAAQQALVSLRQQSINLQAEIAKGNQDLKALGLQLQREKLDAKKEEGPKPPSGYRYKVDGVTLEPIPGGPATVQSPEAAAKTELLVNGLKDVERFRGLLIDKDGKINRTLITGMAAPGAGVPGTDSRLGYSYIYNAIEAKLRAESGAAVPETEVKRMAKRFVPSVLDNDETIKSKVDRLEEFLGGSLGRVKGQPGAGTGAAGKSNVDALLEKYK